MRKKLLLLLAVSMSMASSTWALDKVGNVYQIGTAQDLRDFATAVNGGEYGASAVLTANIDLKPDAWTSPIGSETNPYTGTFDGKGFTISNLNYTSTANYTGFFGVLGNGAVVKNFTIDGTINSTHQRVGVIGSAGNSSSVKSDVITISNIHSKVNLTCTQTRHGGVLGAQSGLGTVNIDRCTYSGTFTVTNNVAGNFAGIVGLTNNNTSSTANITNCLFDGEISVASGKNDTNAGGIVGYTRSCYCKIENCLSLGTITATTPGQFVGQINVTSHMSFAGNNYYLGDNVQGTGTGGPVTGSTTPIKIEKPNMLGSGELCYLLNGSVSGGTNWYQTIGTDANPLPYGNAKVYANGSFECDGVTAKGAVTYSNTEAVSVDPHTFLDGFCSVCGALDVDYMSANGEGYYEINTPAKLKWFSAWVNSSSDNVTSNAKLTDDIDMTSIAATWVPIGDWHTNGVTSAYKGHFDGQGHAITNFNVTTTQLYYGIFGVISSATIENFSISGTITNSDYSNIGVIGYSRDDNVNIQNIHSDLTITNNGNDKHVGGILGSGNAGTTNINRCAFLGTINADDKTNAGGIVGYFKNGATAVVNITNCLFDGTISTKADASNCGGIAGYGGANVSGVKIINCLSLGTITAKKEGQFFGNIMNTGSSITNCYYKGDKINGEGSSELTSLEATEVTADQLASGQVAYKLGAAFGQVIGTEANPVLGGEAVSYVGEAGYATLFDATQGYELKGDAEAFVGNVNGQYVSLTTIGKDVPAATPVVLRGTYYNKITADIPAINIANQLKGSDGTVEGNGSIYALANKDNGVGFYRVKDGIAIPAGKVYLQTSNAVKEFFPFADDETAIENVNGNVNGNKGTIYNIAGQRLSKMQKGLNIVGGKKVMY